MEIVPRMRTIKETARETGLAEHYIRQLCILGKICCVRAGRKWLVNLDKFIDFLNVGEQVQPQIQETYGIRRVG